MDSGGDENDDDGGDTDSSSGGEVGLNKKKRAAKATAKIMVKTTNILAYAACSSENIQGRQSQCFVSSELVEWCLAV